MLTKGHKVLIVVSDHGAGTAKLNNIYRKVIDAIPAGSFTGIARYWNPSEIDNSPTWSQAEGKRLQIYADAVGTAFKNPGRTTYRDYIRNLRAHGVEYFFFDDVKPTFPIGEMVDPVRDLGGVPVLSGAVKDADALAMLAAQYDAQLTFQLYRQDAKDDPKPVQKWLETIPMHWADVEIYKDDSGHMTTDKAWNGMMDIYGKMGPRNHRFYAVDENTPLTTLAIWPSVTKRVTALKK
jgi:hypothetical protein